MQKSPGLRATVRGLVLALQLNDRGALDENVTSLELSFPVCDEGNADDSGVSETGREHENSRTFQTGSKHFSP